MRLLHARFHHGLGRAIAEKSRSDGRRNPGSTRQQYLPLHGLCKNYRGCEICRGARQAGGGAVNKPMPARSIGSYVPMIDGPEKVSGRAKYTADIVQPGQLAGRIYRRPYSHAEMVNVDVSEARKVPGVAAIVTGDDCDKTFGVLPIARSEHPLARDKVRYRGEPVAAVAALDDASAREAIRRIRFTVRELPAYYTATDALAPGATLLHEKKPGNIERDVLFELGSTAQGFADA